MADPDGIGKVTIEQYEDMVIRSLERAGIKLYWFIWINFFKIVF